MPAGAIRELKTGLAHRLCLPGHSFLSTTLLAGIVDLLGSLFFAARLGRLRRLMLAGATLAHIFRALILVVRAGSSIRHGRMFACAIDTLILGTVIFVIATIHAGFWRRWRRSGVPAGDP